MDKITRRSFIKKTAVATVGITAFPMIFVPKVKAQWARKTIVHPNVDNLRVVGITDSAMAEAVDSIPRDWASQERLIRANVVSENMDKLACKLTEINDINKAWHTVFVKPLKKSWSETVVAIKTNGIAQQHTHSAVMAKTCHVLTDIIGIKPFNIHIYDACHGYNLKISAPFAGLPDGVRIENDWGGSNTETAIPNPYNNGLKNSHCLRHLVDGSVDILINMAMCKGHWADFGGFTRTMKNHFGTFSPQHHNGTDYMLAINQTPEILGHMDKRTGKVHYPRQQLCIVEAFFSNEGFRMVSPSFQTNFLAMGVFSPIVDYIIATRFRGDKMGWLPNIVATGRMLTEFGFDKSDLPSGGKLIEA